MTIRNLFAAGLVGLVVPAMSIAACGAEVPPEELPLWPAGTMVQLEQAEQVAEKSKDPAKHNRMVSNVSIPTMTPHLPPASATPAPAVVICPGGAYRGLSIDLEGHDVARWLNSVGVAGIVLKYRVPLQKGGGKKLPLQDVQRAIRCVRSRAVEWNIDPQRVGVMGFSAGGHLAANASNNFASDAYEAVDETDRISCRPDFAILVYPAYLLRTGAGPDLTPELEVTPKTPQTFLIHAEDDPYRAENSLFYYLALKNASVPAYMTLFPSGGHGYGLAPLGGAVASWPQHCQAWMRDRKILTDDVTPKER